MAICEKVFRTIYQLASGAESHGYTGVVLDQAQKRMGATIPVSLRRWYATAGRHVSQASGTVLLAPQAWGLVNGKIVFSVDQDSGVSWMVAPGDKSPVFAHYHGLEEAPVAEFDDVGDFLPFMCAWQALEGGLPFVGVSLPGTSELSVPMDVSSVVESIDCTVVRLPAGDVVAQRGSVLLAGADGYRGLAAADEEIFARVSRSFSLDRSAWSYSTYEELGN